MRHVRSCTLKKLQSVIEMNSTNQPVTTWQKRNHGYHQQLTHLGVLKTLPNIQDGAF